MKAHQLILTALAVTVIIFGLQRCNSGNAKNNSTVDRAPYLMFPVPLTPNTPYDVDIELEKKLLKQNKNAEVQRLFEILSWQLFISLNWPTNEEGMPKPIISDPGEPKWFEWKESYEVFKEDGSAPLPWGKDEPPTRLAKMDKDRKILFRTSKFAEFQHTDTANEIDQAFTAPIWDQNGNVVRYEIRLNEVEFDYIMKNMLYNYDGQIVFYNEHKDEGKLVNFPEGTHEKEGVIEIKTAWKIMAEGKDDKGRYLTAKAEVVNEDGSFSKADVGMVGMHISTKTKSSPQWIWATFEHVDNLETNSLDMVNGKPLQPSFYDPNCGTCPINASPMDVGGVKKNQIQRVLPIPKATQEINRQVQHLLSESGSKLKYYQLIGSQWPTKPDAPAYTYGEKTEFSMPEAVSNKSGGLPVPVYLTNMVMETYFQGGTITPNTQGIDTFLIKQSYIQSGKITYEDTISGFNVYNANEPAFFQIQGFPVTEDLANTHKPIFGTESCIGCHFSGSIAIGFKMDKKTGNRVPIFGKPADSDFNWLLQLKANFKENTGNLNP